MMKPLLLFLFGVIAHPVFSQIQVDSIFIYQDFRRSGTTAGLQYYHRNLESDGAKSVKLSSKETADLKELFQDSKRKRYLQQKHGGEIIYAVVWFEEAKYNYIIEANKSFARMVNLTTMRSWSVQEPEKAKALQEVLEKIKP